MEKEKGMTYESSGVSYGDMDPFKIHGQKLGKETLANIANLNFPFGRAEVLPESIGESAQAFRLGPLLIASVVEGLGTKNMAAEAMLKAVKTLRMFEEIIGKDFSAFEESIYELFRHIGQDSAAMILNDLLTAGAQAICLQQYLAVGSSEWFDNLKVGRSIQEGWKKACDIAGCAWVGGETPTLPGIVEPLTCDIAGAAWGVVTNGFLHGSRIKEGDAIVFYGSNGPQANGISLLRKIAKKLPREYFTKMSDNKLYGIALLEPTSIYSPALMSSLNRGRDVHYAVNVTGHGLRKLMRARRNLSYVVQDVGNPPEIFRFVAEKGPIDEREMFSTYNMGMGFAVYVGKDDAEAVVQDAESVGIPAWIGGPIEKSSRKKVIIRRPKKRDLVFREKDMTIR
jgi:phosphoribosylformylglycinamidine cyclo-ligase